MNYLKKYGLKGCIFLAIKKYNSLRKAPPYNEDLPPIAEAPAVKLPDESSDAPYTLFTAKGLTIGQKEVDYIAKALESTGGDAVFCDEEGFFKPDYSPDCSWDYAGCFLIKSEYVKGKYRNPQDLLWGLKVNHIRRPLARGTRQLTYLPPQYETPKGDVSIIIASKDNYPALKACIDSIRSKTRGIKYEIIVVDNGSNEENAKLYSSLADNYIHQSFSFSLSHMYNLGAKAAKNRFLLFMHDDTLVTDGDWLFKLSYHAAKAHVGAVGAKLCYPDSKTIQHCGVVNTGVGPAYALMGCNDSRPIRNNRNRGVWNYTAVSGACLMIEADKFDGFSKELPVVYYDVEFCVRLAAKGLYCLVDNSVMLYHHQSLAKDNSIENPDKMQLLIAERDKLYAMHPQLIGKDSYHNPNFNLYRADFLPESDYIRARSRRYKRLGSFPTDSKLTYRLNFVLEGERTIVGGYCYRRGYDLIYVVFEGKDGLFAFTPVRDIRPDLQTYYGRDALVSGFYLSFGLGVLPQGEYRVCLMLQNFITGKTAGVKTDRTVNVY